MPAGKDDSRPVFIGAVLHEDVPRAVCDHAHIREYCFFDARHILIPLSGHAEKFSQKSERKALHSIAKKPLHRAADAVEAAECAQIARRNARAER